MELPISDSLIIAVSKLVDDARQSPREPSHYELGVQIEKAGLTSADPKSQSSGGSVGKAKRLRATLNWAIEFNPEAGGKLISLILSQLRAVGGFRAASQNYVGAEAILNVINAFDAENFSMSESGDVRPKILESLSGKNLTQALMAYARRAKQGSEDAALLSGTGKDLLEATAKHIIKTKYGTEPLNLNFPLLLGQAYTALNMAIPEAPRASHESAIKEYERALFNLGRIQPRSA